MIDEEMEAIIRAAFCGDQLHYATPVEEVIESILAYRNGLCEQERTMFDAEVMRGRHPSLVVESLEIFSGRQPSRMQKRPRKLAKAS
jgi:hypothetical protein